MFRFHDEGAVLVDTPGYCMNTHSCSLAASGAAIRVALEDPFICPQCGGSLAPPALETIKAPGRVAFLATAFMCVAIGAGATVLVKGGFFARPAPVPETTTMSLAPALLGGPTVLFTQNTLDTPLPDTVPADAGAAPLRTSRQLPAKSRVPGALAETATRNPAGRHHANVHISVSTPLVAGGLPDYPEQYEDGRSGSVTVGCALQPDGSPTQCHTTQLSGGRIFDVAVHSWLELKDVRFQLPSLRRRSPIRSVTLSVHFIGDAPDQ